MRTAHCLVLVAFSLVSARDITVGPGGDYSTIGQAIGAANAGDVVTIKAGTYNEALTFAKSGNSGSPIVFQGEAGGEVIVDGNYHIVKLAYASNLHDVQIKRIHFQNASLGWMQDAQVDIRNCTNFLLEDVVSAGSTGAGISMNECVNSELNRCIMDGNLSMGMSGSGNDNLLLKDCKSQHNNPGWSYDPFPGGDQGFISNIPAADGKYYAAGSMHAGGGKFLNTVSMTIDGHEAFDNGGPGLWFDSQNKNVTITNCIFDSCQGLALEEVDGGAMENVTVSDLVMRRIVSAPIFIRLGARLRGPDNPPMGVARRIKISNVVATEVSPQTGILISGIPGYRIEDVALSHILIEYAGGGTAEQAAREVPEEEKAYPEPGRFGIIPSWGMFARHVQGLSLDHVELRPAKEDLRPAIILDDVAGADFDHVKAQPAAGTPTVVLKNVDGFVAHNCPGLPDTRRDQPVADEKL